MRFLVDECLSIRVAALLTAAGHDAIHVVNAGLAGQPDD
jgi:predicted nuclease of predicted toxin-antitoxin system